MKGKEKNEFSPFNLLFCKKRRDNEQETEHPSIFFTFNFSIPPKWEKERKKKNTSKILKRKFAHYPYLLTFYSMNKMYH